MINSSTPISQSPLSRQSSRILEDVDPLPLICFGHLPWGFVWQRPQHLLTRIGQAHPVYYVEQPQIHSHYRRPELTVSRHDGVTILTPTLPASAQATEGYTQTNNASLRQLLTDFFDEELNGTDVVAWYYTPLAYGALPQNLTAAATVFDEMDDSASVQGRSKDLRDLERRFMKAVDLVFCAGPSLHDVRKYRHHRVFSFPSGVDVHHFRQNMFNVPTDITSLASPVVGYYGVLDDRVDFRLVAAMADLRPSWSIVMIGPVARIPENKLAHRPNIHYMGMRRYSELPAYLDAFDAAILPYAMNHVTRAITPAKTLEYLAGRKPVVSTPIADVMELYGDVVEISQTADEMVSAIEMLWNEDAGKRSNRAERIEEILAEHNWDAIADRMQNLIHDVVSGRPTLAAMIRNAAFNGATARTPTIPKSPV